MCVREELRENFHTLLKQAYFFIINIIIIIIIIIIIVIVPSKARYEGIYNKLFCRAQCICCAEHCVDRARILSRVRLARLWSKIFLSISLASQLPSNKVMTASQLTSAT